MFQKKRILLMLFASGVLVSCGGGGSSGGAVVPSGSTGTTGATAAASTPNNSATPAPTTPPVPTASTPAAPTPAPSPGSTTPPATAIDPQFNGYLEMVADQIIYLRTNRVLYHPVPFPQFESDSGLVDIASGSTAPPPVNIDTVSFGCNVAKDGTCGVQPPAAAHLAQIAHIPLSVDNLVNKLKPASKNANQTIVTRIAFDLTERADSPGIAASEVPEIMRFVIDKVAITTDADGKLANVQMQDGAQVHVYGRTAAGVEVQDDIPAPAGTVRLMPESQFPDSNGDTSSIVLLVDLENAFSKASQKLDPLKNLAGHFAMNVTLTAVPKIVRPAQAASADYPAVDLKELVGKAIVVNNQPPVNGAGIVGNAWIRMFP